MSLLEALAVSLGLTLLVELLLAFSLGVWTRRDLLFVLLVNVATNPPVVYLYALVCFRAPALRFAVLALLEAAAFALEGFIYSRCLTSCTRNPFFLSLLLNAASFAAGSFVSRLF
ncbi:MAG: hypothetical protein ACOX66_04110 [Oscillospiraceae bacterium]|jgi:hypothetical protein